MQTPEVIGVIFFVCVCSWGLCLHIYEGMRGIDKAGFHVQGSSIIAERETEKQEEERGGWRQGEDETV